MASYGEAWELLRKEWFERPFDADVAPRELTDLLGRRESLDKRLRRTFRDERLRLVAGHRLVMDGHELRNVPVLAGVDVYLEQRFGAWTVPGGLAALGTAMAERLALRGVTVLTGTRRSTSSCAGGGSAAVRTDRRRPGRRPRGRARSTRAACPRWRRTSGARCRRSRRWSATSAWRATCPDLPHEVVLHGDPLLVVRTGRPGARRRRGLDGAGARPARRGRAAALARQGIDVRRQVVARVDRVAA